MNKQIYNIFILKNYLRNIFGEHVPYEIIQIIIIFQNPKISISCGFDYTFLMSDHDTYVWGNNRVGQLGLGHYNDEHLPQKFNFANIKKISCGGHHTMILTRSGEVYACGLSDCGQLGFMPEPTDVHYKLSPTKINLSRIKKIICGRHHTAALTLDNEVYVWGYNDDGQLGLGQLGLGQLGLVHITNEYVPQKLNLPDVKKISCGCSHTAALTSFGEVYVWGSNGFGQLGLGRVGNQNTPQKLNLPNIKEIICGGYHTIVVTTCNEIYVWGRNGHGQLGMGQFGDQYTPQKIDLSNVKKIICGGFHTMALTYSGKVYGWGNMSCSNIMKYQVVPHKLNLSMVKKIACGSEYTIALTCCNEVYVWGCNDHGQLGLGNDIRQELPQKLKF